MSDSIIVGESINSDTGPMGLQRRLAAIEGRLDKIEAAIAGDDDDLGIAVDPIGEVPAHPVDPNMPRRFRWRSPFAEGPPADRHWRYGCYSATADLWCDFAGRSYNGRPPMPCLVWIDPEPVKTKAPAPPVDPEPIEPIAESLPPGWTRDTFTHEVKGPDGLIVYRRIGGEWGIAIDAHIHRDWEGKSIGYPSEAAAIEAAQALIGAMREPLRGRVKI